MTICVLFLLEGLLEGGAAVGEADPRGVVEVHVLGGVGVRGLVVVAEGVGRVEVTRCGRQGFVWKKNQFFKKKISYFFCKMSEI